MFDNGGDRAQFIRNRFINVCVVAIDGGGGTSRKNYIDNQNDPSIRNLSFGSRGTIGNNGCGLVALYNVRVASGYTKGFENFCKQYSNIPMAALIGGKLGMNPASVTGALQVWFGNKNVNCLGSRVEYRGRYDAVIVLYFCRNGFLSYGAHYFAAINDGKGTYTPYNDWRIKKGSLATVFNSVQGWTVHFWGIYFR